MTVGIPRATASREAMLWQGCEGPLREKRKAKDMRMRNILAERSVKGGNPQMMRRAVNRSSKLNDAVVTKVKRF